jgi:CRISPR-associated endonuclease Cas3-HD
MKNEQKDKGARKQDNRHSPLTVSQAIGVFERAFNRRDPNEIESLLREMLNVNIAITKDTTGFKEELAKGGYPVTITVPFGVFFYKVKTKNFRTKVWLVDLKSIRHGEIVLQPCHDITLIQPSKTYLIDASVAGYSKYEGLTFDGDGEETGFEPIPKHEKMEKETAGYDQTIKEHFLGVWNRSSNLALTYKPFVKRWCMNILNKSEMDADEIADIILTSIRIAAAFHDIGKLNLSWQKAVGWTDGRDFIARTKDRKQRVPEHAKYAYPFLKELLRMGFGDYRLFDHIALAAAKHHSLEVGGIVNKNEFSLPKGADAVLEEIVGKVDNELGGIITNAISGLQKGSLADEPPSPSNDFYFIYCIAHRMIKICDWEDAGSKTLELEGIR